MEIFRAECEETMKQTLKMNITWLLNPPGGRQTSWLFTSVAEELPEVKKQRREAEKLN